MTLGQLPAEVEWGGRALALEYRPLLEGGELRHLLVVLSDVTAQRDAARAEEAQRELMALFVHLMQDRRGVEGFLKEARHLLDALRAEEAPPLPQVKRWVHTLKGNCGLFGVHSLARWLHGLEERLEERGGGPLPHELAELSLRWEALEERVGAVLGERGAQEQVNIDRASLDAVVRLAEAGAEGPVLAPRLRGWTWDPVRPRLEQLAARAAAIAERLEKHHVDIHLDVDDTRLPPLEGWERFWSATAHLLRNALDHGVEDHEERALTDKSPRAQVTLRAASTDDGFLFEVQDDGRGINVEALAAKAASRGLPTQTRAQVIEALFADGVSTRDEANELSGRGVGMGAVREAALALGAQVEVHTARGAGSRFRFTFPRALASAQPHHHEAQSALH